MFFLFVVRRHEALNLALETLDNKAHLTRTRLPTSKPSAVSEERYSSARCVVGVSVLSCIHIQSW
jgi:hypothetical protein